MPHADDRADAPAQVLLTRRGDHAATERAAYADDAHRRLGTERRPGAQVNVKPPQFANRRLTLICHEQPRIRRDTSLSNAFCPTTAGAG